MSTYDIIIMFEVNNIVLAVSRHSCPVVSLTMFPPT